MYSKSVKMKLELIKPSRPDKSSISIFGFLFSIPVSAEQNLCNNHSLSCTLICFVQLNETLWTSFSIAIFLKSVLLDNDIVNDFILLYLNDESCV